MKRFLAALLTASLILSPSVPVLAENITTEQNPETSDELKLTSNTAYVNDDYNLYIGEKIDYYLWPVDTYMNHNPAVKWSTSDSSTASVENGVVSGIKPGTFTLTAEYGGKTYSREVTVHRYKIGVDEGPSGLNSDGTLGKAVLDKLYLFDLQTQKRVSEPLHWKAVKNTHDDFVHLRKKYDFGCHYGNIDADISDDGTIHPVTSNEGLGNCGVQTEYGGETIECSVNVRSKWYSLKVDNAVTDSQQTINAGSTVSLFANEADSSQDFDHWEVVSGHLEIPDEDKTNSVISIMMPCENLEIKAVYKPVVHANASTISSLQQQINDLQAKLADQKQNNGSSDQSQLLQEISNLKQKIAQLEKDKEEQNTVSMYRLYNPNTGEHFYTSSDAEKNHLVESGWNYEGIGWNAPAKSKTPVYRLYNPNAHDHHYTVSNGERKHLISLGWKDEGIGWYSSDSRNKPVYRQYNPKAKSGAHNYTLNQKESRHLVSLGWKDEGIAWYAE